MKDKIDLSPLRGMRDFPTIEWVFRKKLLKVFEKASEKNGFLRYDTCVVDAYELFERKSGEEISDQIYEFYDKSHRHLALRPEITPTMVRLYCSEKENLPYPAKIWSFGQCFRYERPTKGRYREHFQWNLDIIGEESVSAEAYLLYTAVMAMNELGFDEKDFRIYVSSRAMLSDFLSKIGIETEKITPLMTWIDKKDKIGIESFRTEITALGLSSKQVDDLMKLMEMSDIEEIEQLIGQTEDTRNLKKLIQFADILGYGNYIKINPSIVRGLSYYTGIVFEAFDIQKSFRALFAGGRYDQLFSLMIGKDFPACGFGFGDGVIKELFYSKYGKPEGFDTIPFYIGYFDETLQMPAMKLMRRLKEMNFCGDFALKAQNPKKFFTAAHKRRAEVAVYIAPAEYAEGKAVFKNMQTGEQSILNLNSLNKEQLLNLF